MKETKIFEKPKSMIDVTTHYCPGCTHGVAHRLVAEVIDELQIQERTVAVAPVGCSVFLYNYINVDSYEAAHGRAPAVASACKRLLPDSVVFSYQGDGDLASIGMAEIVHAANRGEKITVIFINNAIYGMTGGQMAPTTLVGQKATTCPLGRDPKLAGYPIRMCEMLATLQAPAYITRVSVAKPKYTIKAKEALTKAFQTQIEGKGFSFVEILSTCPTNWGLRPVDATNWLEEHMMPEFPLGVFKTPE
ncbi:MAG: 2-oxoglutarate oxidoreductase [Synergistaceae bacterium]|jgi:2-oxoglutarate ferredoxin oxidoreductase subunit beta|nr:2-oxoglutarate oxidoreductase [Synergistaceae bacterium]